jgi:low temperature requirement protein LtrA
MAVAIPNGFGEHALLFAGSYVALQVVRNAFVVLVTPPGRFNQNFRQILTWSLISASFWLVGGLDEDLRWALWLIALGVDLGAPFMRYWLPGVGSTPMSQWEIDGRHFAERFQLFVIIALGESIVLAGITASEAEFTFEAAFALAFAFLISTAMWWLYFDGTSPLVARRLEASRSDEAGGIGRDVYTYLHFPVVAGIVVMAVGAELVIGHPKDELHLPGALVLVGGVAVYLLGLLACRLRVGEKLDRTLVAAVAVLVAALVPAGRLQGWIVLVFVALALIVVIVVERRGEIAIRNSVEST